jgi:hypothetical protein
MAGAVAPAIAPPGLEPLGRAPRKSPPWFTVGIAPSGLEPKAAEGQPGLS